MFIGPYYIAITRQMGHLIKYPVQVLIIAVCLLPSFKSTVAAQSPLDPSDLPDIPGVPLVLGLTQNQIDTEIVDAPNFAPTVTNTSQFLVKTSTPMSTPPTSAILAEIYFDWTRQALKEEVAQILEQTAGLLQHDSTNHVTLQSSCDHRGTSAYSITLRWRRTAMIADYLKTLGIPSAQLTQISHARHVSDVEKNTPLERNRQHPNQVFRLLAMTHSRAGCLVHIHLQHNRTTRTSSDHTIHKPFLQRLHLAESR